jgi:exodeoxyribonuclease VII small subunit
MVVVVFIALLSFFKYTNAFNDVKKIDGIEDVAQTFDEFEIPEGVRVVGIGEATHGNREFQLAKKAVLEKVVNELENGEMNLDESLVKFEQGMKLSKECNKMLEEAEKKITILLEKDGEIEEENFEEE